MAVVYFLFLNKFPRHLCANQNAGKQLNFVFYWLFLVWKEG